jgi:hypothetical protein
LPGGFESFAARKEAVEIVLCPGQYFGEPDKHRRDYTTTSLCVPTLLGPGYAPEFTEPGHEGFSINEYSVEPSESSQQSSLFLHDSEINKQLREGKITLQEAIKLRKVVRENPDDYLGNTEFLKSVKKRPKK